MNCQTKFHKEFLSVRKSMMGTVESFNDRLGGEEVDACMSGLCIQFYLHVRQLNELRSDM